MTPTGRDVPGAPVTIDSGHRLSCRSQLPKLRYVRDAERRQDASHRRCLHDRRCSWPIRPCGCPGRVGRESSTSQPGEWYLLDLAGNTTRLFYCSPGDLPIVGDRDHDGDETPGPSWRSDGSIYLRNSNRVSPTSGSYLATPVTPLSPVTWTMTGSMRLGCPAACRWRETSGTLVAGGTPPPGCPASPPPLPFNQTPPPPPLIDKPGLG